MEIRQATFAIRVVRRRTGHACIIYRRSLSGKLSERLTRIAALSPKAYLAASQLVRHAIRAGSADGKGRVVTGKLLPEPGPFYPLDPDWGARVTLFSMIASGLNNSDRLRNAAGYLAEADASEASWWLGMIRGPRASRVKRALRILVEAVR